VIPGSCRLDYWCWYLLFKVADFEACKEAWKASLRALRDVMFWRTIGSVGGVDSVESFKRSAEEACSRSACHANIVSMLLNAFKQNVQVFYARPAHPARGGRDAPQPAAASAASAAAGTAAVGGSASLAAAGGLGGQGSEGQRTRPHFLVPNDPAALDDALASLGETKYAGIRFRMSCSQQLASAASVEVASAVAVLERVPGDDRDEVA
jgi:hypothetical protein